MNRLLILKDVAYGAQVGGGTVGDMGDALAPGAFAMFNEGGDLIPAAAALSVIEPLNKVTLAVGRTNDTQYVQVPRKIKSLNRQNYRAAVKKVITISAIDSSADIGDVTVSVYDDTFTSRFYTRRNSQTVYKSASTTDESVIDALVILLNADKNLRVTAAKTSATSMTITAYEDDVDIKVAVSGLFAPSETTTTIATTTPLTPSVNKGVDILQLEKDYSVEEGNSNAIDYNTEYYSRPMETVASSNYNIFTVNFDGTHDTPSQKKFVMHNTVKLAVVTDASTFDSDDLEAQLQKVFQTNLQLIEDFEALE